MKRFLLITLTILLILSINTQASSIPIAEDIVLSMEIENPKYEDDRKYSGFVGRLDIGSVGIDVALYHSNEQYVVDRKDSAAYFDLSRWRGHFCIADHKTQDFANLSKVKVGTTCVIHKADGTLVYYQCVDVFNGHNTGKYISDLNYEQVMDKADLLMYTCLDNWKNVRITLWNETQHVVDKVEVVQIEIQNEIEELMLKLENLN